MKRRRVAALVTAAMLVSASTPSAQPQPMGQALWLPSPVGPLRARAFAGRALSAHPRLIVVLHGDLDHPGYHYRFAAAAAAAAPDTVAVGLLRPGYVDTEGDRSAGRRGTMTADNYTPQVLDALASAIAELRTRYGARDVTLVGHSGGSVLSADLLERRPDLSRRALLVSCPCDVAPFRLHMALKQLSPVWLAPTRSVSPMTDPHVLAGDDIALVVGGADDVAPRRFSEAFASAAQRAGAHVTVQVLPGLSHNILLEPAVLAALVRLQGGTAEPSEPRR